MWILAMVVEGYLSVVVVVAAVSMMTMSWVDQRGRENHLDGLPSFNVPDRLGVFLC